MKDYKILLVCSGGMSTTILMTKMQKYAEEKGFGSRSMPAPWACAGQAPEYDVILLGPQIAYQKGGIAAKVSIRLPPCSPRITRWLAARTSSSRSMRFWAKATCARQSSALE